MSVKIYHGDCLEVMKSMADGSVDAVVTDPPYHLTSVSRGGSPRNNDPETPFGRTRLGEAGFMGKTWDGGDIAFRVELWAEVLRVLKPGGHLLAFSGTRTYHRMVCAIEDAGFEIRDQIGWLYGSGFPKSLDVSKALDKAAGAEREVVGVNQAAVRNKSRDTTWTGDVWGDNGAIITAPATDAAKQWAGWGTALKPAWEPIVVARKPLIGAVAQNVAKYGTGAMNIDGCRVETDESLNGGAYTQTGGRRDLPGAQRSDAAAGMMAPGKTVGRDFAQPAGRWPANIVHDGSDEVLEAFAAFGPASFNKAGVFADGQPAGWAGGSNNIGAKGSATRSVFGYGDTGTAARFFYCAKASREERNLGCEGLEEKPLLWSSGEQNPGSFQAEGTKRAAQNNHPTVKPVALMQWLVRLITPPGGTVLDPFAGSGSTGIAAHREGFHAILIEREAEYVEIARRRLAGDSPLFSKVEMLSAVRRAQQRESVMRKAYEAKHRAPLPPWVRKAYEAKHRAPLPPWVRSVA